MEQSQHCNLKARTSSDPDSTLSTYSANREGPFPDKLCPHCGIVKSQEHYYMDHVKGRERPWRLRHHCKDCARGPKAARIKAWTANKKAQLDESYAAWKAVEELLPTNAITEEQWHSAIKYFNGCAMCEETHVETREFFQLPKDKGRYSVINILPMCRECSVKYRGTINPFQLYSKYCTIGRKMDKAVAEKLLQYFMMRITEAADEYISKQT